MSEQYDNSNKGAIWKNDKKTTDTQPDFTGSIDVEGVDYWLSGWLRPKGGAANTPSMKFCITEKEPKQESNAPDTAGLEFDDSIPF